MSPDPFLDVESSGESYVCQWAKAPTLPEYEHFHSARFRKLLALGVFLPYLPPPAELSYEVAPAAPPEPDEPGERFRLALECGIPEAARERLGTQQ